MTVTVNGHEHTLDKPMSVAELLATLKISTERGVAVERNREIIPKSRHDSDQIQDGDTLEIITAFAGG